MVNRRRSGLAGLAVTMLLAGCHIPANSPLTGLAQLRPHGMPHTNVLPPAAMLQHPGPGVEGPGPGIITPASYGAALAANGLGMDGGVALTAGGYGDEAGYEMDGMGGMDGMDGMDGMAACPPGGGAVGIPYGMGPGMPPASQIGFIGPDGMQVRWDMSLAGGFDSPPLVTPGRYDFPQGAMYRLKLTDLPGYEGVELYPTLEVAPVTPRTDAFLAHNTIPFQLTEEDLDQVTTGNFVTKVVYLPDPDYQELAVAGVETLVSTRLDPGVDPVVEADRRGSILAIIRIGNKDLESAGPGGVARGFVAGGSPPVGVVAPLGMPVGGDPAQVPPAFVAGMTAPEYGMPRVGTPIGLPGPAHIPLGIPAGLRKHTITNHTKMHIPPPSRTLDLHVQQAPGLSYPKPARHAYVAERHDVPHIRLRQPPEDRTRFIDNGGVDPDSEAAAVGMGRGFRHGIEAPCPPEPLE